LNLGAVGDFFTGGERGNFAEDVFGAAEFVVEGCSELVSSEAG
jgi:hypothetical protein